MATKLIPRLQDGGILMRYPALASQQKLGSSLVEQQLLKARNAQTPPMAPIQPIALNNSYANKVTGLGSAPGSNVDTGTLAGTKPSNIPGTGISPNTIGSIAQGVASLGIAGIDAFSKAPTSDQFGITRPEDDGVSVGKSTLQSAGSGAATGATIGSVIPGIGTAIGAVAGGLVGGALGFFKGKKDAKEADKQFSSAHSAAYGKFYGNQYANQFAAMQGKDGMKLRTSHIMDSISASTRLVPRMKQGGAINIIADGKLHRENNNLGNNDKGIPVIDKKGKKIFELEKEEWILNLEATKDIERLVSKYNKDNDDATLETLGKLVRKELITNTRDNSNKFGLEV